MTSNTLGYRNQMQIRSFRGQYATLSNFGGSLFVLSDNITSPEKLTNVHDDPMYNTPNTHLRPTTAEHHFQALKTLDMKERWWVYGAATPKMAKSRGRLVTMREDWPSDGGHYGFSLLAMSEILAAKFAVPSNRKVLLATEGFDLIEGNTHHDQIWGDCECVKHRDTPGQNLLGKLLVRERELILTGRH